MLTQERYEALCKIRDSFVPVSEKPDDMTEYLAKRRLIMVQKTRFETYPGQQLEVEHIRACWKLSIEGEDAIEEYEAAAEKAAARSKETQTSQLLALITLLIALFDLLLTIRAILHASA